MDQLSAHLDRGWELVQRGDPVAAEVSARRALELDAEAPEAHNLLGFVAALREDYETAREHYQRAVALDDTYMEAILNEAELCVHTLEDYSAAIELCDEALELAEDPAERAETLLLKFDALMGLGDRDAATQVTLRLPQGPFEDPYLTFLVGRALFEVEQWTPARELLERAISEGPDNPDAHYYLGLWLEHHGELAQASQQFARCARLDSLIAPPPWSSDWPEFEARVQEALARVKPAHVELAKTAELFVVDGPGAEVIAEGVDPRTFLLLDDESGEAEEAPQAWLRIFIYKRNLERAIRNPDELLDELVDALNQELDELSTVNSEPPLEASEPSV